VTEAPQLAKQILEQFTTWAGVGCSPDPHRVMDRCPKIDWPRLVGRGA
jgi:predicted CoA-binding protein